MSEDEFEIEIQNIRNKLSNIRAEVDELLSSVDEKTLEALDVLKKLNDDLETILDILNESAVNMIIDRKTVVVKLNYMTFTVKAKELNKTLRELKQKVIDDFDKIAKIMISKLIEAVHELRKNYDILEKINKIKERINEVEKEIHEVC